MVEAGGPTHEAIANRAYELYEDSGRLSGNDLEHWFSAKAQLSNIAGLAGV